MEKQKKFYIVSIILLSAMFLVNIALFLTKIFKLPLFIGLAVGFCLLIVLCSLFLRRLVLKLRKIKKDQRKHQSTGDYQVDLYGILGIPIQYNKDGSIKSIYDLIGIVPIYDESGNRVLTVYELLGIMPKFDQNGVEIPSVVSIKNRVNRIARVDLTSRILTRKLTETEKELLAMKKAAEQKLKEKEVVDNERQQAIKKAFGNTKKNDKGKSQGGSSKSEKIVKVVGSKAIATAGYGPARKNVATKVESSDKKEKNVAGQSNNASEIKTANVVNKENKSDVLNKESKKIGKEVSGATSIIVQVEEERSL